MPTRSTIWTVSRARLRRRNQTKGNLPLVCQFVCGPRGEWSSPSKWKVRTTKNYQNKYKSAELSNWYQLIHFPSIGARYSCQILNPLQQNKVSTISCLQLSMCQTAASSCNPDKCSGEGPFFKTETITGNPGGAITKEIVITGIN